MTPVEKSWDGLLGLPLAMALARLSAAGVEAAVQETVAPRRSEVSTSTLRVIRVREAEAGVALTVSAFMDGDPRRE